jgi:hypothetical protein
VVDRIGDRGRRRDDIRFAHAAHAERMPLKPGEEMIVAKRVREILNAKAKA